MSIKIIVNGVEREIQEGLSLKGLIDELSIKQDIVVEHNGSIIPMNEWGNLLLHNGDSLEVVSIVGGG